MIAVRTQKILWRVTRIFVTIHHQRSCALVVVHVKRRGWLLSKVIGAEMSYNRAVQWPNAIVSAATHAEHVNIFVEPAHHVVVRCRKMVLTFAHDVGVVAVLFVFFGTTKLRVHQAKVVAKLVAMRARCPRTLEWEAVKVRKNSRRLCHSCMAPSHIWKSDGN